MPPSHQVDPLILHSSEMNHDLILLDSQKNLRGSRTFLLCSGEKDFVVVALAAVGRRLAAGNHSASRAVPVLADPALALLDGSCCSSPYLV